MRKKSGKREGRLEVRVSDEEYRAFGKAAKSEGLTLSAWVRRLLLAAIRRKK